MNDHFLDKVTEKISRGIARKTSRRGLFGWLGASAVGAASLPLLPVARADHHQPKKSEIPDAGDDAACDYWRYCAIDGFLCTCCGGSVAACPPGTEMSPITWIGTCKNPVDSKSYVISYNDCCGKSSCGRCLCNRNDDDRPVYRPSANNDINWCVGTSNNIYNCSTAVLIGLGSQ
mgnify:CR=1 FL=1